MATIKILGDIGLSVQAQDVIEQILAVEDDKIKVLIASPGGSALQGLMIHDALKASGKEITTIALGLGASAAFIIFLAGDKDKREMGDTTLLMGHNSRTELCGTATQIRDELSALDAIDDRMKAAVMAASDMSDEDAIELLSKDSFMNLETAMSLGLASGSIQDDIAASLNINITKKEPVKMATEEETKQAGFLAYIAAYFKGDVKAEAEDDKPKEDEDAKAESEDEDVEVEEEKEAKAGVHEDEDKEEAKAETDDEKEEMRAKIESLEAQLADTKAKAEGDEEEKKEEAAAKINLILAGITDKKVTMHEANKLSKKPLSEVKSHLDDLSSNATGRGKTQEPVADASSKHDQWRAMLDAKNHGEAQKFYNLNVKEIRSEMNKEK